MFEGLILLLYVFFALMLLVIHMVTENIIWRQHNEVCDIGPVA